MFRLNGHSRTFCRTIPFQGRRCDAPWCAPRHVSLHSATSIGSPRRLEILAMPTALRPLFLSLAADCLSTSSAGQQNFVSRPGRAIAGNEFTTTNDCARFSVAPVPGEASFKATLYSTRTSLGPSKLDRFLDARPSWQNIGRIVMKFQNRYPSASSSHSAAYGRLKRP